MSDTLKASLAEYKEQFGSLLSEVSMAKTRECKGCDGTGENGLPFGAGFDNCPACGGETVIHERIGREDAIADAETLHCNWWAAGSESPFVHLPLLAAENGLRAATKISLEWHMESADWHASVAARAAFRAVPGLRG